MVGRPIALEAENLIQPRGQHEHALVVAEHDLCNIFLGVGQLDAVILRLLVRDVDLVFELAGLRYVKSFCLSMIAPMVLTALSKSFTTDSASLVPQPASTAVVTARGCDETDSTTHEINPSSQLFFNVSGAVRSHLRISRTGSYGDKAVYA